MGRGRGKFDPKGLFLALYQAGKEEDVCDILTEQSLWDDPGRWRYLGDNPSNFGTVHNQQSSSIEALVEKLTNSIDAILMRRVAEKGLDPQTMDEAVDLIFGDTDPFSDSVARLDIQVHSGTAERGIVSPVIYDAGEGQHPDRFCQTFLALSRGMKVKIPYVQGAYHMGGSGALSFCGELGLQLIGSCRHSDPERLLGFTVVRREPIPLGLKARAYSYQYLVGESGRVLRFPIKRDKGVELGLKDRRLDDGGTVIKLYSYQFEHSRANIAQDIAQGVEECLVAPVLPITFIENKEKYQRTKRTNAVIQGVLRKLLKPSWKEQVILERSETVQLGRDGEARIRLFVFKPSVDGESASETRKKRKQSLRRSGQVVVFTINGQSHGSLGSNFVSRTLKFPLLKDDLLIFVDCTALETPFRTDVFMASRDRMRNSKKMRSLVDALAKVVKPILEPIHEERMSAFDYGSGSSQEVTQVIRDVVRDCNLERSLSQYVKGQLDWLGGTQKGHGAQGRRTPATQGRRDRPEGGSGREGKEARRLREHPTVFRLKAGVSDGTPRIRIPNGGAKAARFEVDVNSDFFTRTRDPGDLELKLINLDRASSEKGGSSRGRSEVTSGRRLEDLLRWERSDPENGEIVLNLVPRPEAIGVGDEALIQAVLRSGKGEATESFRAKIVEPRQKGSDRSSDDAGDHDDQGLPDLCLVARESGDSPMYGPVKSWKDFEAPGISIDDDVVAVPAFSEKSLERVIVNLDSQVFQEFLKEHSALDGRQRDALMKRYVTAVYMHTVVLAMGCQGQGIEIRKATDQGDSSGQAEIVEINDFLGSLIRGPYVDMLLRFDLAKLLAVREETD